MSTTDGHELRIALSMRGGVSLAVWIGGAVQELDRLTRASALPRSDRIEVGGPDFYAALVTIAGYERAVLDVITGASAGGLNGVVLAASRAYGFGFDQMLPLWVSLGDIELLARNPTAVYVDPVSGERTRRPASLLQGNEYFQKRLRSKLAALIVSGDSARTVRDPFDLILSATLVNPLYETTDVDPFVPLPELRRSASFQFRYLGELGAYGGDFEPAREAVRDTNDATASLLALAGRTTSSFPLAFEPASVGREASRVFSDPPAPNEVPRRVLDGGVLDNIPVAKAIEAIAAAPGRGIVDRWLVFLHPSPSARTEQANSAKGLAAPGALRTLAVTASAAFGQESLLDDLAELQQHNAKAAEQRWRRAALLHELIVSAPVPVPVAPEIVTASRWARSQLDAARAVKVVLGEVRVRRPLTEGSDRARSTEWLRTVRNRLPNDIAGAYVAAFDDVDAGVEDGLPWQMSPVRSAAGMLLGCDIVGEWMRSTRAGDGGMSSELVVVAQRLAALRDLAELGRNWSDQAWLAASSLGPDPATPWACTAATAAVRSWRSVPDDALHEIEESLGVGVVHDDCIDDATVGAALARLDERMRAVVGALSVLDCGRDLAEWFWTQLVAVAAVCGEASNLSPLAGNDANGVGVCGTGHGPERYVDAARVHLEQAARDHQDITDALANIITISTQAQSASLASDDEVRFIRITGSNDTPLRSKFVAAGEPFGVDQKLCGNELANFAAFFSARWRANDWMWGRLDAVKSVVDLLLRPERLRASTLDVDETVELVRHVTERLGMPLDDPTVTAIKVEVGVAKQGGEAGPTAGTVVLRRVLTEAMQRHVFSEMCPVIETLGERPRWPNTGVDSPPPFANVTNSELDDRMRRYRVGSETIGDLDSRRRTQIGMRLSMVAYRAFQPSKRTIATRVARLAGSLTKPFYLFGIFAALNVARAVFLMNMTAVGFWVGPWRYRNDGGEQTQPWWRLTTGGWRLPWTKRGLRTTPPVAPGNWAAWTGFAVVALLSLASLALWIQVYRRRRRARRQHHAPPDGLFWYLASFVLGVGALAATITTGMCIGPTAVVVGAGVVALLTCLWMRTVAAWVWVPLGTMGSYVAVGLGFWAYATMEHRPWFAYTGWMAVLGLYAAQVFISVLCTYCPVLYNEEQLLEKATSVRRKRWLTSMRSSE